MTENDKLLVPALRAKMGDNVYYISFLTMREIAKRVSLAEEIHQNKGLRELILRISLKSATGFAASWPRSR